MEAMNEQTTWHKKPVGELICPICGCDNVRAGVEHRATMFGENWAIRSDNQSCLWIKRISVCFGTDHSIEPIFPRHGGR